MADPTVPGRKAARKSRKGRHLGTDDVSYVKFGFWKGTY